MTRAGKRWIWFALGLALGVLGTLGVQWLYRAEGFARNAWGLVFEGPLTATKVLILVAFLVTMAALPIAILDLRSERRFRAAERRLREEHPEAEVAPYEGPEGEGVVFSHGGTRRLLLRPQGGLGEPRVLHEGGAEPEGAEASPAPA